MSIYDSKPKVVYEKLSIERSVHLKEFDDMHDVNIPLDKTLSILYGIKDKYKGTNHSLIIYDYEVYLEYESEERDEEYNQRIKLEEEKLEKWNNKVVEHIKKLRLEAHFLEKEICNETNDS